jgi:CRP-like cAMP-binding protein
MLSHVPLFAGVSKTVLTHLAESLSEEEVPSRAYVITAGDPGSEMYFLTHGVVEVLLPHLTPDGMMEETWTANLNAGSWFGEIALLMETTRNASVRSLTPCALFRLDKPDFRAVVEGSEELREAMQKETERRMQTEQSEKKKEGVMAEFALLTKSMKNRLEEDKRQESLFHQTIEKKKT